MEALKPGDPGVVGRYRLSARLGDGRLGAVFLGADEDGETVAIRLVRPDLATDAKFLGRFRKATDAVRAVDGTHVARVLDADADGTPPWLAAEYAPGITLADAVRDHGPLPEESLRALGSALARALAAVHEAKVTHQGLSSATVQLTEHGPQITDLGISAMLGADASSALPAPEQATGGGVRPATDVFALAGVVCAAAGVAPYGDTTGPALAQKVLRSAPDLAGLPEDLVEIVAKCLAKRPDARPSAAELAELFDGEDATSAAWLPKAIRAAVAEATKTAADAAAESAKKAPKPAAKPAAKAAAKRAAESAAKKAPGTPPRRPPGRPRRSPRAGRRRTPPRDPPTDLPRKPRRPPRRAPRRRPRRPLPRGRTRRPRPRPAPTTPPRWPSPSRRPPRQPPRRRTTRTTTATLLPRRPPRFRVRSAPRTRARTRARPPSRLPTPGARSPRGRCPPPDRQGDRRQGRQAHRQAHRRGRLRRRDGRPGGSHSRREVPAGVGQRATGTSPARVPRPPRRRRRPDRGRRPPARPAAAPQAAPRVRSRGRRGAGARRRPHAAPGSARGRPHGRRPAQRRAPPRRRLTRRRSQTPPPPRPPLPRNAKPATRFGTPSSPSSASPPRVWPSTA
ncbi:serine/threonine-protein kinase [Yinghuangia aomiensis]